MRLQHNTDPMATYELIPGGVAEKYYIVHDKQRPGAFSVLPKSDYHEMKEDRWRDVSSECIVSEDGSRIYHGENAPDTVSLAKCCCEKYRLVMAACFYKDPLELHYAPGYAFRIERKVS